jgi:cell division septation protein DedD
VIEELQEQAEQEPEEPKIGLAKLLGIFAGLVVVCAFFFSLGYSLGKKSAADTLIPEPTATATAMTNRPKPSAAQTLSVRTSGEQFGEPAQATAANSATPNAAVATEDPRSKPSPELAGGGNYVVQIAAVSRQEDAEALVNALRKKDYPVFVISNVPGDKLFHVQIGPYAEMKDAEAMKAKLAGDGYNPIVKK